MSLTVDDIVEVTKAWPADELLALIERLSLEASRNISPDIDRAWKSEIDRRLAQVDAGSVQLIPGEVVAAEIRKLLGE